MTRHNHLIVIGLLALGVVAYFLPWVWHPDASLSPGGRDLAEWTTLHPEAHAGALMLLPSFLLRSALGLVAVLLALTTLDFDSQYLRWGIVVVAAALALSLFPPLDFITTARGDPNYRQQFVLCVGTLVLLGLVAWRGRSLTNRLRQTAVLLIAGGAMGCGLIGLAEGLRLVNTLGITLAVGGGGLIFAGLIAAAGLLFAHQLRIQ